MWTEKYVKTRYLISSCLVKQLFQQALINVFVNTLNISMYNNIIITILFVYHIFINKSFSKKRQIIQPVSFISFIKIIITLVHLECITFSSNIV